MFNKRKIKLPILAIAGVVAIGLIAGTWAYFSQDTTFNNQINVGDYDVNITEEFRLPTAWLPGETAYKDIKVKNTGNTDVLARVKVGAESFSATGETEELDTTFRHDFQTGDVITAQVYSSIVDGTAQFAQRGENWECSMNGWSDLETVIKSFETNDYWVLQPEGTDGSGYYYGREIIPPNASTGFFGINFLLNPLLTNGVTESTETIHKFPVGTPEAKLTAFLGDALYTGFYTRTYDVSGNPTDTPYVYSLTGLLDANDQLTADTIFVINTETAGYGTFDGSRYQISVEVETIQATKQAMVYKWLGGVIPIAEGIVKTLYNNSEPIE